ncbi:MAG: hypothetical protein ACYC7H_13330, partial [Chloroflexota bacterium]
RTGTLRERHVDGILNDAYDELGEDFSAFTARVCVALHGRRPAQIERLSPRAGRLRKSLTSGRIAIEPEDDTDS